MGGMLRGSGNIGWGVARYRFSGCIVGRQV